MTANLCARCGRPTPDGYLDTHCGVDQPRERLTQLIDTLPAARDIATGQARHGTTAGSGKPGSRTPLNLAATARLDLVAHGRRGKDDHPDIRGLVGWCRTIAAERYGSHWVWTTDPILEAARWLTGQLEWMRHRPGDETLEFLEDIDGYTRVIRSIVDRGRNPGRYAGPCSYIDDQGNTCGQDVIAKPGSNTGICKTCGSEYDVDEQQEWMRSEIEDQLARPVEISGMLSYLGLNITYRRIMKFVEKGHLLEHGSDTRERPLYRVGDVLEIIARNEKPRRAG